MKIECKKCCHVWDYTGDSEYYITCPRCLRKIKAIKVEEEELLK